MNALGANTSSPKHHQSPRFIPLRVALYHVFASSSNEFLVAVERHICLSTESHLAGVQTTALTASDAFVSRCPVHQATIVV